MPPGFKPPARRQFAQYTSPSPALSSPPSISSQGMPSSSPVMFTPSSQFFSHSQSPPPAAQIHSSRMVRSPSTIQPFQSATQSTQFTNTHPSQLSRLELAQPDEHTRPSSGISQAAGFLVGQIDGETVRAVIELNRVLLVGRSPRCDIEIDSPYVSNVHLCFTPVKNDASTTVTVINLSENGIPFEINGIAMNKRKAKIGEKQRRTNGYILKELDQISFLQCPDAVLTFYQGPGCQGAPAPSQAVPETLDEETRQPLFQTKSPYAVHRLSHWTVNNIQLGKGSFGEVHLATHKQAAWLQVACKSLKPTSDNLGVKSLTEVKVLLSLNHPNVNTILDLVDEPPSPGVDFGRTHIILELMVGGDLFSYLLKHGTLPEMEVKWIAYQLVEGLKYIHEQKVAHRDIKPENIFLAVSAMYPRVVIGDFGHAITYDEVFQQTPRADADSGSRTFPVIGTMSYIPPERLKIWSRPRATLRGMVEDVPRKRLADGKLLSKRDTIAAKWFEEETKIDAWSLGVTLYEVVAGAHPYSNGSHQGAKPDTLAMVPARHLTSNQSWADYRKTVGESHRLGTAVAGVHGTHARDMYEKCRGRTDWWMGTAAWRDWSDNGYSFMGQLFAVRPEKRLTMSDAAQHNWFKKDKAMLEKLYKRVVTDGEVLNPATDTTGRLCDLFLSSSHPSQGTTATQGFTATQRTALSRVAEADEDIEML